MWAKPGCQNHQRPELIVVTLSRMQDYYEDRSESWQESQRGEEHQEKIAAVEAVLEALQDLIS